MIYPKEIITVQVHPNVHGTFIPKNFTLIHVPSPHLNSTLHKSRQLHTIDNMFTQFRLEKIELAWDIPGLSL
jgi:hypothetical protein